MPSGTTWSLATTCFARVYSTPKKLENETIAGHFEILFEENSARNAIVSLMFRFQMFSVNAKT